MQQPSATAISPPASLSADAVATPSAHLPHSPQPMPPLQALDKQLLDCYQHHFPLLPRPFEAIARQLGVDENTVIDTFGKLLSAGLISRIGAVFQPNVVGVSALAALAVPPQRLDQVAQQVNAHAAVNHNYAREHRYNLWFVATAADPAQLAQVLQRIEDDAGAGPVLTLPLLEQFHIDLGFDLGFDRDYDPDARPQDGSPGDTSAALAVTPAPARAVPAAPPGPIVPTAKEIGFMASLQNGLPLTSTPFAQLGLPQADALALLARWRGEGVIKRFGVVVRHHELGYNANAMVVWDVPDAIVGTIGRRLAASGDVSLCYRRPRHLPDWPYNLFCMLHGKDRGEVERRIAALVGLCRMDGFPHAVLFSTRRYKQCGARYASAAEPAKAALSEKSAQKTQPAQTAQTTRSAVSHG